MASDPAEPIEPTWEVPSVIMPAPNNTTRSTIFNPDNIGFPLHREEGRLTFRWTDVFSKDVGYTFGENNRRVEEKLREKVFELFYVHGLMIDPRGENLPSYPYCNDSKLNGPISLRERKKWELKAVEQSSPLITFLNTETIGPILLDTLSQEGHLYLANLAGTCQTIFGRIHGYLTILDVAAGEFFDLEKPTKHELGEKARETNDEEPDDEPEGKKRNLSGTVSVMGCRQLCDDIEQLEPSHKIRTKCEMDNLKWEMLDKVVLSAVEKDKDIFGPFKKFVDQPLDVLMKFMTEKRHGQSNVHRKTNSSRFEALPSLLRVLSKHGSAVTTLHLHGLDFVDWRIAAVIMKDMPSLRMVGIYNCGLIHVGNVTTLLDVIGEIKTQKKRHIDLDIAPRYHRGPYSAKNRIGEFGVTWQAVNMDVQIGLGKIVVEAYLKARALGIDLLSPGKAFRHFLENVPLPPHWVAQIIHATSNIADWAKLGLTRLERRTLLADLCAAVTQNLGLVYHWMCPKMWLDEYWCSICRYYMPVYFYHGSQKRRPQDSRVCDGCELSRACQVEMDHMKQGRLNTITKLLPNHKPNERENEIILPPNAVLSTRNVDRYPHNTHYWGDKGYGSSTKGLPTLGEICAKEHEKYWWNAKTVIQATDYKVRYHLFMTGEHYDNKDPDHMQKDVDSPGKQWTWASILEQAKRDKLYQDAMDDYNTGRSTEAPIHQNTWDGFPRCYKLPLEPHGWKDLR